MNYRLIAAVLSVSVVCVAVLSAPLTGQTGRKVTLITADGKRERVQSNSPTLPSHVDAKSIRILVDGGPVSLCEKHNFGNPCLKILNKRIACELENCFNGAGDWRNRIRSVRFD